MWEGNWGSLKTTCVSNALLPWQDHISLLVATHGLLTISRFPQRFPQRWISLASNVQRPISLSLVLCPNMAQCPAPKAPPIFPHPESDRSGIWELLGPECRVTSLTFPLLYCLLCLGSGSLALHNVYSCCHGGPALLRFHSFELYREHAAHLQRSARLCRADGNWIRTA